MSNLLALSTLLVMPLSEMDQLPAPDVQQIVFVRHGESQFNLPDEMGSTTHRVKANLPPSPQKVLSRPNASV